MEGEKVGLYALVKLAAGASTTGSSTKLANVLIGVDMPLSNITTDIYTYLYLYQATSPSELTGLFGSGSISAFRDLIISMDSASSNVNQVKIKSGSIGLVLRQPSQRQSKYLFHRVFFSVQAVLVEAWIWSIYKSTRRNHISADFIYRLVHLPID